MEQSELLQFVCTILEQQGINYLVTGSQATIVFGEPRFTNDIDILVDLDRERLGAFLQAFSADDFYVSATAAREAVTQRGMFNIIHPTSGLKLDIIIPENEYERSRFARGRRVQVSPNYAAVFTAPEDIIVKKLQFFQAGGSDRHLRDIAGVLKISGDKIDRAYIAELATQFGVSDIWRRVLEGIE